ncbi:hypothetical protein CDCA_CDCA09G2709 [Cyanidium caldarium]|uniref:ATPase n=1 Tax=Cyanidium caldarium TaxID=2771 RepID=A0AAV9IWN6_CYACA|nr:hypothetical protein CDCA_CDCA09G2709 [Cyanidium caldarium]
MWPRLSLSAWRGRGIRAGRASALRLPLRTGGPSAGATAWRPRDISSFHATLGTHCRNELWHREFDCGVAFSDSIAPLQRYCTSSPERKPAPDVSPHNGPLLRAYRKMVRANGLEDDPAQEQAVQVMQASFQEIVAWEARGHTAADPTASGVRGVYLWSERPGTGKTALMDFFYETLPVPAKQRWHFHAFMLDIQRRLHQLRAAAAGRRPPTTITARDPGADRWWSHWWKQWARHLGLTSATSATTGPLEAVAQGIIADGWVLCLDELQVTDVADAMVLRRLFRSLIARGLVLVATSNRPPEALYANGLQRDLFIPFITQLQRVCRVHPLLSPTDYRVRALLRESVHTDRLPLYLCPDGPETQRRLDQCFAQLTGRGSDDPAAATPRYEPVSLPTFGRILRVPRAIPAAQAARFYFDELCDRPLSAADYLLIAQHFRVVFVERVPVGITDRNIARRWITLIDTLYDQRVTLVCAAAGPPETLFRLPDRASDEAFAAQRCISRLYEMQTVHYLSRHMIGVHERDDRRKNTPVPTP